MMYELTARERKLFNHLQIDDRVFQIRGQLPVGVGTTTLERLTSLGLLETGAGRFGDTGWRLSEDGWRCMYGLTRDEMNDAGAPYHPLKVWSWPFTPDAWIKPARKTAQLTPLPPRLAELPPRLKTVE